MERIELAVREKESLCEIFVGFGVFEFLVEDLRNRPLGNRLAILTDTHVQTVLGYRLQGELTRAGIRTDVIAIPPGEESKRWETVRSVFEEMIGKGYDRQSGLVAVGGGVVGDITGFVAALYMRSIPYVQVPTTLLAQVDSSLGGKNGIDLPHGKNLVGTFYQPRRVYVDPSILVSLPHDEFRYGLAEVIKSAIVRDRELFHILEECRENVVSHHPDLVEDIIIRCCHTKSSVVMADEKDVGGRRILNFGHTVGHAIEAYANYRVPHGAAVSMGMAAEAVLSTRMGVLIPRDKERILSLLCQYGLPTQISNDYDTGKLLGVMRSDKKAEDGQIAVVLPTEIGHAVVRQAVPIDSIREALREVQT